MREPLLLAGDYAQSNGPFGDVLTVLRTGMVEACGFKRVSFAGHPEGHPKVAPREIRQAQVDKWRVASEQGMQVTFVTQFFFASKPFRQWLANCARRECTHAWSRGAGPAGIARLLIWRGAAVLGRHTGAGCATRIDVQPDD